MWKALVDIDAWEWNKWTRLEATEASQGTRGKGSSGLTRLIHTEIFGGLLPALGVGLPYNILDRNYLLMNESLKKFVEVKSGL